MSKITLHTYIPSMRDAEAGGLLWPQGQTRLHSETFSQQTKKNNDKNNHFKPVFHGWTSIRALKQSSLLNPEYSWAILRKCQSQRRGWGPPAAHLLMVHLTTLGLSWVDANVKGAHKAIFLEMQRRCETRNITKKDNWLVILWEFE